jgi:hypothetical protein
VQFGVFLVAFSGLLFEIGLTRIFSATIWYHFAFVAVSVALLGWGLGGFALHLLRDRAQPSMERAAWLTLLYAASIPAALAAIVRLPFLPERLPLYFAASLVPFLLAGAALAMLFGLHRAAAGRLYFADLLGASLGALAVTLLLSGLGGENAVLAAAVAPFAAAACFSPRLRAWGALGAALVIAAMALNERTGAFKIHSAPTKGLYKHMARQPGAHIALTGWNSYSRIDAVEGLDGSLARLYIDSDAWTNLHRWDGHVESIGYMAQWYRARPFQLAPARPETLVIGSGGGSDVLVGLASGSRRVTIAEMNPLMLRFVRHYGAQAGNLYDHPQVETHLSEGRNFLAGTARRFDVIFLGFVDSWAAVASGGLSLSENYLYTTDAFQAYLDHLTPDGLLAILRWRSDIPRLVSNAVAVLGAEEASRRVVVLIEKQGHAGDPPQMAFILRARPFTAAETATIMSWSEAQPVIVPGRVYAPPYDDLLLGRKTPAQYEADAPKLVGPVTDDRPFYFAQFKPLGLPPAMARAVGALIAPIALLCAWFALLGRPRGGGAAPYAASIAYFAGLGLGFITVELALLQNLTLLLGHPIFTLSILLFTLLAAGGLGASWSPRFRARPVCFGVAALGIAYAFVLPLVVPPLLPLPLAARVAAAVALVAPLGFAMGMPFPQGLSRVGHGPLPAPAFYWGLNGVLSVIGSVGTMALAVTLGFRVALVVGSLFYVVAGLAAPLMSRAAARAAGDERVPVEVDAAVTA